MDLTRCQLQHSSARAVPGLCGTAGSVGHGSWQRRSGCRPTHDARGADRADQHHPEGERGAHVRPVLAGDVRGQIRPSLAFALLAWGMFIKACRELVSTLNDRAEQAEAARAEEAHGRAWPSDSASPARCTTCLRTGCRCCPCMPGHLSVHVPPTVGRTVYRIAQEGLTNSRKHAPGSAVTVEVAGGVAHGVTVSVDSPLSVNLTGPIAPGSGTGLIGLPRAGRAPAAAGGPIDDAAWRREHRGGR